MGDARIEKKADAMNAPLEGEVHGISKIPSNPVLTDVRVGKVVDELTAAFKDDRLNTKKALVADSASAAKVIGQYDRVIAACERELRRKGLTEEQRLKLLGYMVDAANSSKQVDAESRGFQREQLAHSRKAPWKLIGGGALVSVIFIIVKAAA